MLLEFSCSNFKSIKDKVTFSFVASKDDTYQDELKSFGNVNVLRTAAIYGANGSGKSNFLNSFLFMRNLVINSINHQPGSFVSQFPHKLSNKDELSTFSVQFVKNNIRYVYGFSIGCGKIVEEYLYYFPNGKQTKIFERSNLEVTEGSKFKGNFDLSYQALKENRLFLSCLANFSRLEVVEWAFLFFKDDIVIYDPLVNNWVAYSAQILQDNEKIKESFIGIMRALGTNIIDIKSSIKSRPINELPDGIIPEPLRGLISSEGVANEIDVKLIYDDFDTDLLREESKGVQRLFEVICPIIDIINNGKLLIFDEIETSLHEVVVCEIIKLLKKSRKDNFAQLLFSTHDTSLLDAHLFRRDQIWFTQLKDSRMTDLYSLVQINNVRKNENLKNGYISGKYGAIPFLSTNISDFFGMNGDDCN